MIVSHVSSSRSGTAYVAVIGACALIATIGLCALAAIRTEARAAGDAGDFMKAMFAARSAIEKGLYIVANDSNWRLDHLNGTWEQNVALGNAAYTLEGKDPVDAILGNLLDDPLWLEGTGFSGDAKYKLHVELVATGGGYTCLEAALHSKNDLKFNGALVTSTGPVSANHDIIASGGSIVTASPQAVNAISGGVYVGAQTVPMTARTSPDTTVFDYYKDSTRATKINFASLPTYSGDRAIQSVTLSAGSNPYGTPNSSGFYYVDCGGAKLVIRNAKISGTLTVLNANTVTLRDSVNWESPSTYPSLLVDGKLSIQISATSFLLGLDLLPSVIKGLFYSGSDITISNNVAVTGVLVGANNIDVGGTVTLTYDSKFLNQPPPGFGTPRTMKVVDGSWRRLVD